MPETQHPRFKPLPTSKKVCILTEDEARSVRIGIGYTCNKRAHHHYSASKVEMLVSLGELEWIGKHKKIATFVKSRSLVKVHSKFVARYHPVTGQMITEPQRVPHGVKGDASYQLVRGGGSR